MTDATPAQLLEDQHRRIDRGIKGIFDGSGGLAELAEALELLRLHIHTEEAVLFPPLEAEGLTMPVFVMQREHGLMWPLLEQLRAACAASSAPESLQDDCRELFKQLQIHNPKEEQILYTAADRLAEEQGSDALARALAADQVPPGWACARAPK
ncbi:MAG TPA: hemerythrin domain-containing protein [Ottowia sp.]|mgnify:CR=1 FL=1|uniref:hemerythrin domain-containing protein n=1 Tax=Ottowia sp. TaxID=1898956 RepID=UPI002C71CFB8|nr:hemerythrin domain-containing protein [Ottowia sp.]HMN19940.1 hemerythrin domain-containing protein [Ottowia sp.]